MRTELLKYDLILNKKVIGIYGFFLIVYSGWLAYAIPSVWAFATMGSLMAGFLGFMTLTREHKFRTAATTCSLPVTRREIILSRFLMLHGTLLLSLVFVFLIVVLFPLSRVPASRVLRLDVILWMVFLISLTADIIYPFLIAFGLFGLIGLALLLQVLGIALHLLLGIFHVPMDPAVVIRAVQASLTYLKSLGTPFYGIAVLAPLALDALSYRISLWIFSKKDL